MYCHTNIYIIPQLANMSLLFVLTTLIFNISVEWPSRGDNRTIVVLLYSTVNSFQCTHKCICLHSKRVGMAHFSF